MNLDVFDRLDWKPDRMLIDDLVFRLEHYRSDDWDGGDDYFRFFKTKELVELYRVFFSHYNNFQPHNIFEIGTFDGGSTVFWNEVLHPRKHISIDIMQREDSPYFRRYISSKGLGDRIKTYWGIDQADKDRLLSIISSEYDGNLDLVIDDASHLYGQTRASFEVLFPQIRPGGLYIIEDWAWGHWGGEYLSPDHPWAAEIPLTKLVVEMVEVAGTSTGAVSNVIVNSGFVVVERGWIQFEKPANLDLESLILRRPDDQKPVASGSKLIKRMRQFFSTGR